MKTALEKPIGFGLRSKHLTPIVKTLSSCAPTLRILKRPELPGRLSFMAAEFAKDPFNDPHPAHARVAAELGKISQQYMDESSACSLQSLRTQDLLVVQSLADTFTDPLGSVACYERSSVRCSRTLLLIGGCGGANGELRQEGVHCTPRSTAMLRSARNLGTCHLLCVEPGTEALLEAMAQWVLERAEAWKELNAEKARKGVATVSLLGTTAHILPEVPAAKAAQAA